jgi:hypothetical protein
MIQEQTKRFTRILLVTILTYLYLVQMSPLPSLAAPQPITFHVAPAGADTPDCGLDTSPCQTIQHAINLAETGDVILVAAGTYTYSGAPPHIDCNTLSEEAAPVLCVMNKELVIRGGFHPGDWSTSNPEANPTIVDGENAHRGVSVIAWSAGEASLEMEGFTIRQGLARGSSSGTFDVIGAYGGGLYAIRAPIVLRNMVFEANRARGGDTGQTYGGTAAGGAVALNSAPEGSLCTLEQVTFVENQALGGDGRDRGGSALGGGLYVDTAAVYGDHLHFANNTARAGNSTGSGRDTEHGWTADGLGGGAALHVSSSTVLENLVATGNQAIGGNAGTQAGAGHGGALYAEQSSLEVMGSVLRENRAQGGDGIHGFVGGGGAIMTSEANLRVEQSQIIQNEAIGGNGTSGASGAAGGGGLYLTRFFSDPQEILISNSIIAGNVIKEGYGTTQSGGGGGGLWLQGVRATIKHTTIARNHLDNLVFGVAAILVSFGCQQPASADLAYSIVEGHEDEVGSALHVWEGNTLNVQRCLFAANSRNSNAGGYAGLPAGTINGLDSCLEAESAEFVSPGSPNHDYHLRDSSPAMDQAINSNMTVDVDGEPRPVQEAPDIGADEVTANPLQLTVYRPASSTLALAWQLSPSLRASLDHYQIELACEEGAASPNEGDCGSTIHAGQETTLTLTGLTDGKQYTLTVNAYDASGGLLGQDTHTAIPAATVHVFLPLVRNR